MSSTQELSLLTLFIIRPLSSDQTDFISVLIRCLKGTSFMHRVMVQKHVPEKRPRYNIDTA